MSVSRVASAPETESRSRPWGAESGEDGAFHRQDSTFRGWVVDDPSADFPLQPGRYHLYVARACPWAHRTIIARRLMGLEEAIGISFLDPVRDDRGWAFTGGQYVDEVNGFDLLREAYLACEAKYELRVTVPVLWDKQSGVIVNNESGDILRMLSTAFAPLAARPVNLYPEPLRTEIDELNEHIYHAVNNGVYKAGFSTKQSVYEREVQRLFEVLDELDARLADRRFLFEAELVETDVRLFTTLVRFDAVYQIHFKCSLRKLVEYPNLWPYARDVYQWPGVGETVDLDEIRAHYYRTHPSINPSGLMAMAPAASFREPHGRQALSAASAS
jgi:putative glutathione S-transferase